MKPFIHGYQNGVRHETQQLMQRTLNPFCGLVPQLGFMYKGSVDPRSFIAGADLCGVHLLHQEAPPRVGAYHIGGGGVFYDEALIKSLGESVERHAQLVPLKEHALPILFKPYNAMLACNKPLIDKAYLDLFTAQQFNRPHFPFQKFDAESPLAWTPLQSLIDASHLYVPTQLLFLGYRIKRNAGEKWLTSAVTTGTATHVTRDKALKSALLELIQLDTTMGHWYTRHQAYHLQLDARTQSLQRLLDKTIAHPLRPQFYWLPSPDLKGFVVACLFKRDAIPKLAIGLGADTSLVDSMYKAYLEALGVLQMTKMLLINQHFLEVKYKTQAEAIYDLDSNVALYAKGYLDSRIREKFLDAPSIVASKLPPDIQGDEHEQIQQLIQPFKDSKKQLLYTDLTTQEALQLKLSVARVWSPQLLSLALPSAVPSNHPRFADYGGVSHEDPHPYP